MVFTGETPRTGLTPLGKARHGFWVQAALAVSADGLRAPLGVLSLVPFVRTHEPPSTRREERARFVAPDKESRYWREGIAAVRTRVGADTPVDPCDGSRGGQLRIVCGAAGARRPFCGAPPSGSARGDRRRTGRLTRGDTAGPRAGRTPPHARGAAHGESAAASATQTPVTRGAGRDGARDRPARHAAATAMGGRIATCPPRSRSTWSPPANGRRPPASRRSNGD